MKKPDFSMCKSDEEIFEKLNAYKEQYYKTPIGRIKMLLHRMRHWWITRAITSLLLMLALLIPVTAHAAAPEVTDTGTGSEPHTMEVTVEDITAVADQIAELDAELDMLARLVYAEARGVDSKAEQAAVIWCVLNRVDAAGWASDIAGVVTARHQFAYSHGTPVTVELRELARDVVTRWLLEARGITDVGRVLPAEYCYFAGHGGHNWFRQAYRGGPYWNWSLPDPYESEGE